MNTISIYRAFRTRCHPVYERPISPSAYASLMESSRPYIQWMACWDDPHIFTKACIPQLTAELAELPYDETLDAFCMQLEGYPTSWHNGATREYGIIVSVNGAFRIGKYGERQYNWVFDKVYIVKPGKRGLHRTLYNVKGLPTLPRRTKTSSKPPSPTPPGSEPSTFALSPHSSTG